MKNKVPLAALRSDGDRLDEPGFRSANITVPPNVPSLTHNSVPYWLSVSRPAKNSVSPSPARLPTDSNSPSRIVPDSVPSLAHSPLIWPS